MRVSKYLLSGLVTRLITVILVAFGLATPSLYAKNGEKPDDVSNCPGALADSIKVAFVYLSSDKAVERLFNSSILFYNLDRQEQIPDVARIFQKISEDTEISCIPTEADYKEFEKASDKKKGKTKYWRDLTDCSIAEQKGQFVLSRSDDTKKMKFCSKNFQAKIGSSPYSFCAMVGLMTRSLFINFDGDPDEDGIDGIAGLEDFEVLSLAARIQQDAAKIGPEAQKSCEFDVGKLQILY